MNNFYICRCKIFVMEGKKNLYPIKFIPVAERKPWGGNALIKKLGKQFVECDKDGNETVLTENDHIGESWEISDMGFIDSVVAGGWLAGNTFEEIMETYIERIVGEDVYRYYGRQFPVLVKFLDIQGRMSVHVHPDDETAEQRYDTLGKCEMWYVMDAAPQARIYMGFKRDISAQELYDRCQDGTIDQVMNVIHPRKGDTLLIRPGTVHSAEGGLLVAEIQESSDLTFRLYDWGREKDRSAARPMHLEEAFDIINMGKYDFSDYRKGPLWGDEAYFPGKDRRNAAGDVTRELVSVPQFTVSLVNVHDPLKISTEHSGSFLIYICTDGEASVQTPGEGGNGHTESCRLKKGETVLIPADIPDFFIVPVDRDTVLLEVMVEKHEEVDGYINPDTEPFLEGEDYGGVEDEDGDEDGKDSE